jgi:hypothetical protein
MAANATATPSGAQEQQTLAALLGGLVVVVVVAAVVALGAQIERDEPEAFFAIPLGAEGVHMPFSGSDNPAALPSATPSGVERPWSILGGTWGTLRGAAYVVDPVQADATTLALLPSPRDVSVVVTLVVVADNTGVVGRFVDEQSYVLARVRTRESFVELVEVRDGHAVSLARSPDGLDLPDGAKLRLLLDGTSATVSVNGVEVATASVPTPQGTVFAGLMASGSQATVARFDDLTIVATSDLTPARSPSS